MTNKKAKNKGLYSFPRSERLGYEALTKEIFARSATFYRSGVKWLFLFRPLPKHQPPTRILISVPKKKFPLATQRNRIKRQFREAWRICKATFSLKLQDHQLQLLVIAIFIGKIPTTVSSLQTSIQQFFMYLQTKVEQLIPCTLLADSGSTKTEWRIIPAHGNILSFSTNGFNPNTQSVKQLEKQLKTELVPQLNALGFQAENPVFVLQRVQFYGAGFSQPEPCEKFAQLLQKLTHATEVRVEHDLLGAAIAVAQSEPAIVCILGTGSNSALYDGQTIVKRIGGYGYLFSDEGSGADLGKRLLQAALREDLPPDLLSSLLAWKKKQSVIELTNEIYHASEKPNTLLAKYAIWIQQNLNHQWIQNLVQNAFSDFLQTTVLKYPEKDYLPVWFVGSIGWYFRKQMLPLLIKHQLILGGFIQNPIEGLVNVWQKNQVAIQSKNKTYQQT
ncbi:MAG: ribonuclease P protein component [Bacteroidia bacterium]|nr:ribonuclease P protein component [Bacteroidia bacterium]